MAIIKTLDRFVIHKLKKTHIPLARVSLFIVFFWFGFLKVIDSSPANPLVRALLEKTLPFLTFDQFIIGFGLFEMVIGVTFIIPRLERLAIALLIPHMIMTFLPLVLLPSVTWQTSLLPTMEGQYIIKNLVIVALAFGVAAHLSPMRRR